MVIKAQLRSWSDDNGYVKYVFENVDMPNTYVSCTKFPGWETKPIHFEETGFLEYKPIKAGIDEWYNDLAKEQVKYRYNMTQFIDFVPELPLSAQIDKTITILITYLKY